jgi:hypothetical protein
VQVPAPVSPDRLPAASRTRIGLLHTALRQRAVMAIKLVTEVMDWAPPLTHREHKVLMILAENARLSTRETWDSVESPLMLHRARLTRPEMYAVIGALVAKGCLSKPVWGGRNHRAKYAIAHLAPGHDQCREKPDTENHDQCPGLQDTDHGRQRRDTPSSVSGKIRPRLPGTTGRGKAGLESAEPTSRPRAVAARRGSGGTTPAPSGGQASNSVALASEHNGSEPVVLDVQQIPIEVHLQSQATDRNAREARP